MLLLKIRKAWFTAVLLITSGKQMSNSATCFNRIYVVILPSYTELPW